ncbi:MAG: PrsW family intramembrane metalloprotease [Paludibacteraceae bacterium]|nr:PrsW family intramembrane metalloprotease [Paludibacteraceae bacterium]
MTELLIIVFAAILPAFLLVVYIWWRDKYQREPLNQMMKGVLYGVVSAMIAAWLEGMLQGMGIVSAEPNGALSAIWAAFAGAALPEEAAKLLMLWLLLRKNPWFDERMDGIVYAVCVGMGFAGTENILYLVSNIDSWQEVAVSRAITAVPGHFIFAVAMGYFYSMAYFGDISWRKRNRALLVPILLHGTYDGILFVIKVSSGVAGVLFLVFCVFCAYMFRYGRRRINEHLERDMNDPNQVAFWVK